MTVQTGIRPGQSGSERQRELLTGRKRRCVPASDSGRYDGSASSSSSSSSLWAGANLNWDELQVLAGH